MHLSYSPYAVIEIGFQPISPFFLDATEGFEPPPESPGMYLRVPYMQLTYGGNVKLKLLQDVSAVSITTKSSPYTAAFNVLRF